MVVKTIFVDGARTLKRMLPAPQGRAYRLRKRSNHVTLIVDAKVEQPAVQEEKPKAKPKAKASAKGRTKKTAAKN